jgi:hypothetical protein
MGGVVRQQREQSAFISSRFKKGKFCIIAEKPGNIGPGVLQISVAIMKGKRASHTTAAVFAILQNSVADVRGCFPA